MPEETICREPLRDNLPDVTKDALGAISGLPDNFELFDVPEQRMDETGVSDTRITGKYPVRLTQDAMAKVIDAFERKMTTSFFHAPADRELTYTEALIYQAGHCRKVIEGEADIYQPILLK